MKRTPASKIERAKLIRAAQGVDRQIAGDLRRALLADGSVVEEELERAVAGLNDLRSVVERDIENAEIVALSTDRRFKTASTSEISLPSHPTTC